MLKDLSTPKVLLEASIPQSEWTEDGDGQAAGVFETSDPKWQPGGDGPLSFTIFKNGQITMDETWCLTPTMLKDIVAAYRKCGFQV